MAYHFKGYIYVCRCPPLQVEITHHKWTMSGNGSLNQYENFIHSEEHLSSVVGTPHNPCITQFCSKNVNVGTLSVVIWDSGIHLLRVLYLGAPRVHRI